MLIESRSHIAPGIAFSFYTRIPAGIRAFFYLCGNLFKICKAMPSDRQMFTQFFSHSRLMDWI